MIKAWYETRLLQTEGIVEKVPEAAGCQNLPVIPLSSSDVPET